MVFILLDIRTRFPLFSSLLNSMLHGPLYFPFSKDFDRVLSEWLTNTEVMSMLFQTFQVVSELNPRKMCYSTFRQVSALWEPTFFLIGVPTRFENAIFESQKPRECDGPPSHFAKLCVNDDGLTPLTLKRNY